jgi:hypothetical protein
MLGSEGEAFQKDPGPPRGIVPSIEVSPRHRAAGSASLFLHRDRPPKVVAIAIGKDSLRRADGAEGRQRCRKTSKVVEVINQQWLDSEGVLVYNG